MATEGSPQSPALGLIDRFNIATGKFVSWFTLIMVLVTAVIVILRYVFDMGFIWLQESVTWMHALVFMAGAAFTLQQEEHVRVDIFYRATTDKGRAWTDLIGVLVFLLPLCAFLAYSSYGFAAVSWSLHEASREPGGLAYPMIPLLKSVLVFMPIAVALQGASLARRSLLTIRAS
jgi:TRAP-type mannitol/chloroaromatic compound transport system permease small subunit